MRNIFEEGVEKVLERKRHQNDMKTWFLYQERRMLSIEKAASETDFDSGSAEFAATVLKDCVSNMPLSIPEGSAVAGSLDEAFSPSYALINPSFKVEDFAGYCDPLAVYDDI